MATHPELPGALATLPLATERIAAEPLRGPASDFRDGTTLIRLAGSGAEGLGEDVTPFGGRFGPFAPPPPQPLEGRWTLAGFCERLAELDLWEEPPEWELMTGFRRWAFESAALDLALRQNGRSLPEVLERAPRPVRFVNSLGLGDEPSFDAIAQRLEHYPELRFKLDAVAAWTPELMDELAATGAVEIVDFKGRYGMEVEDEEALVQMYAAAIERFPDALFEDPHELPSIEPLAARADRISFDAPIRTVEDIGAQPHTPAAINVKPSRIGSLATLLDIYAYCERVGLPMYGGGMGELSVGRGQAQLLAAMVHPDGPNDLAPSPYNDPPLAPGLPTSPLVPGDPVGFRW